MPSMADEFHTLGANFPTHRYVVGFAFTSDRLDVALIRKNKPNWQRGLLNGIGGKVEEGEAYSESMVREFREETGVEIPAKLWKRFATLRGPDYVVACYHYAGTLTCNVKTLTEEPVSLYNVHYLPTNVILNLRYLIPLALDTQQGGIPEFCYQ